jgi:tetratricopeptide (TPR) repeat protein
MDNIQKLREKVEKDPKSTVFVRLADELKKAGELDEAIEVLKAGIERQPGYSSARVALGKVYHEKGMEAEAKAEFMQVIETVPDNLFARKKLAEIYRAEGDNELALQQYRKYLSLSPMDDEIEAICKELQSAPSREKKAEGESPSEDTGDVLDAEGVYLEGAAAEEEEAGGFVASLDEEDDAYAGAGAFSLQDQKTAETAGDEDLSLSLQDKETSAAGAEGEDFTLSLQEKEDTVDGGADEVISQNDIDSMIEEVAGVPEEEADAPLSSDVPPAPEPAEAAPEVSGFESFDTVGTGDSGEFEFEGVVEEEGEEAVGVVEIEDTGEFNIELEGVIEDVGEDAVEIVEAFEEPVEEDTGYGIDLGAFTSEEAAASQVGTAPPLDESFREADALVAREEYVQAMGIYRKLLAMNPGNSEVQQRAGELKGLIKFLGKDKEIIEARLQAFLITLKRKQHEFFGSP